MAIRLVLADDHPIVLDGLEQLFRREPDFQVVARCVNGREALIAVREHRPDILILDIRMPDMDGLAVIRAMQPENLSTRVVLLTGALEEEAMLEALQLGVQGMVLKEMPPQLLVECVRKVHAGEQWLERRSFARVLDKLSRREAWMRELRSVLTPREIEVVHMVARGTRNKEIAEKLFITEGTVKVHLHHIYEKLQVTSRVQLIRLAQEKGLV